MINLDTYKKFLDNGFSVVPTHNKMPMGKGWQDGLSFEQIESAITFHSKEGKEPNGVGLVMLNNLEALDFDTKHDVSKTMMYDFTSIVEEERPDIYDSVVIQQTQSGGQHWIYKCEKRDGNTKLAKNKEAEAIIETRGIGGQIVVAPTEGYKFIKGNLSDVKEISVEQRAYLWGLARSFNQYEDKNKVEQAKNKTGSGKTAFNDYNDQCTLSDIKSLFTNHGWKIAREFSDKVAIKRDGTTAEHSGYIFSDTLRTYIYSTSTSFEPETPYLPYAVYTMLEHGGDYTAAAKDLYSQGYGEQDDQYSPNESNTSNYNSNTINVNSKPRGYVPFKDYEDRAEKLYKEGNPKGQESRFNVAKEYISYRKKYSTYFYAAPTSGKTEFAFSEMVYLSHKYGWKWAIYSIESGDPEDILGQVASVFIGKLYSHQDLALRMTPQERVRAIDFYKEHFFVIDPLFYGNEAVVDEEYIIEETKNIEDEEGIHIDGIYIDPVTELDDNNSQRIDQFIKRINRKMNDDAKANNRHNILVYHVSNQTALIDKDTGKTYFPEPHPREMAGGQNPFRQGHQIINIYRPTAGMIDKSTGYEFLENETHVIIYKSRPKGVGKKGRFKLFFDWKTNRYYEDEECRIYSEPLREPEQSEMDLQPTYTQPISKENSDFEFGGDDETPF